MKSMPKLIRRFVGILLFSFVLLIVLNILLLYFFTMRQTPNAKPWKTAEAAAKALERTGDGAYILDDGIASELKESNVWAILIDNDTKQVVWHTDHLPETVPMSYTLTDIAQLTRGYIDGFPTFTGGTEDGLVVLGYPKDRFWKHMWSSWDYELIANLPKTVLKVLFVNVVVVFLIYMLANTKLLKSVRPITKAIQDLSAGEPVHLRERGLLSEIAANINRTSDILQTQQFQLRKKETARANWIAGVSHDIRTPLSMVMGYAGQLKEDVDLTEDERQKAEAIVRQSERMKNLVNDLNLASKLEYHMQPVHPLRENIVAIVRRVVVDFMNMGMDDRHPIEWETDDSVPVCFANVNKDLIKRAVSNLIQNSIDHNAQGCKIRVSVMEKNQNCIIAVADDGRGAADEHIEKLNSAPHYMFCDENITGQRHGLGLLIVKQIAVSHGGSIKIAHSPYGGLAVQIIIPAA